MCVIIHKPKNVTIPFDKLQSAATRNRDGYGFLFSDTNNLESIRNFDPKGNDPEEIAKTLEELHDIDTLLHMRYATAGAKDLDNCHPFELMTKHKDGLDVAFMHNGTIHDFNNYGDESDSISFVNLILRPLFERSTGLYSDPTILDLTEDDLNGMIISKYAGATNVFTFMDGRGNIAYFNKSKGKEFDEGWWASNNSYFSPVSKHTPTKSHSPVVAGYTFRPKHEQKTEKKTSNGGEREYSDIVAEPRETTLELFGFDNVRELQIFDYDEVLEIVTERPDIGTTIIMDLLYELYLEDRADVTNKTKIVSVVKPPKNENNSSTTSSTPWEDTSSPSADNERHFRNVTSV